MNSHQSIAATQAGTAPADSVIARADILRRNSEIISRFPDWNIWRHFAELSAIPRESGNEAGVIQFLRDKAQERGWSARTDEGGNLVLVVPGRGQGVNSQRLAVQMHVDMVCKKAEGSAHNFLTDPIQFETSLENINGVEKLMLCAKDTTLGADNGAAYGLMMELAESDEIPDCPPLELVFTVNEETGLIGAQALGKDMITAPRLINLDTERSRCIRIGCAGSADFKAEWTFQPETRSFGKDYSILEMKISDLPGGHSGLKINLDIPNPVVEIASTFFQNLHRWESHWDVHLVGISAGEKRNVIANSATISLVVRNDKLERLRQELGGAMMARFFEHKEMTSGKISFSSKPVDADAPISYVPSAQAYKVSRGIMEIAHGAIEYTHYDPKLVATSNNVAILNVNPEQATLQCLTRSSIDGGAALVQSGMEAIVAKHGAKVHKSQGYPGWDCPPNDPFLLLASATFKRHFGEKPVLHRAHGGIECGAFRLVRPDLQMISLAINILDAHTTKERVEVDSVSELWGYLKSLASDLC